MKMFDPRVNSKTAGGKDSIPLMDHWFRFTEWVFDRTSRFPKSCRFTVSSRIDMLMLDGIEKIVEARFGVKRITVLESFNILLEKLRFFFRLAYSRKYFSTSDYEYASSTVEEIGRMTGGWLRNIRESQT